MICPFCYIEMMPWGERIVDGEKYAVFRCTKCGHEELVRYVVGGG